MDPALAAALQTRWIVHCDAGITQGPFMLNDLCNAYQAGNAPPNLLVQPVDGGPQQELGVVYESIRSWCVLQPPTSPHNDEAAAPTDGPEDSEMDDVATAIAEITATRSRLQEAYTESFPMEVETLVGCEVPSAMTASHAAAAQHLVVVDTNVLLTHLATLRRWTATFGQPVGTSTSTAPGGSGDETPQLVYVIPWIVLCELDDLKMARAAHSAEGPRDNNRTDRGQVAASARSAIIFLHEKFKAGDRSFKGQTLKECQLAARQLPTVTRLTNDDRVLQCAMHLSGQQIEEPPRGSGESAPKSTPGARARSVTLLTNDRGLSIKAIMNQIPAHSTHTMASHLTELAASPCPLPGPRPDPPAATPAPPSTPPPPPNPLSPPLAAPAPPPPAPAPTASAGVQARHPGAAGGEADGLAPMDTRPDPLHPARATRGPPLLPANTLSVHRHDCTCPLCASPAPPAAPRPAAGHRDPEPPPALAGAGPSPQQAVISCQSGREWAEAALEAGLQGMAAALEHTFRTELGDGWQDCVSDKPPWAPDRVVHVVRATWGSVLREALDRSVRDRMEDLEHFRRTILGGEVKKEFPVAPAEGLRVVEAAAGLLEAARPGPAQPPNGALDRVRARAKALHAACLDQLAASVAPAQPPRAQPLAAGGPPPGGTHAASPEGGVAVERGRMGGGRGRAGPPAGSECPASLGGCVGAGPHRHRHRHRHQGHIAVQTPHGMPTESVDEDGMDCE